MSLLTALTLALLARPYLRSAHPPALTETGAYPFAVDFSRGEDIRDVQVRYFVTGAFGGYGEFVFDKSGDRRILLHTAVKGTPAVALKAILYVPGCQIGTIDVPSLAKSSREFAFECRPLPTLAFTGRVVGGKTVASMQPVVNVTYIATWSLNFFGVADGMASTFQIATVPLEADSVFHVALPDFSKDPVTRSYQWDPISTRLNFMVRDAKTWNILGRLAPSDSRSEFEDLPILSKYPAEVVFTLHKM